ncbi:MAG: DUF6427 family protein [Bacteroidota bacterium]
MITTIFKKSTPINYSLVVILVLFFFFLYQIQETKWADLLVNSVQTIGLLVLLMGSLFLSNFIVKKNGLTKNSSYTLLFFLLFLLFFPSILKNVTLVLSNFFILLAMRRLVSLQTLKAPKEKIFDASLWIFVASLFHFWAVLFILLVYISILFHVSRDYRNWLLPIVALFTTAVFFIFYALLFDKSLIGSYLNNATFNFEIDYFTNTYQNLALSIFTVFAVFFVFSAMLSLTNRPLNLQASYKKMIFAFFIGVAIFVLSTNKSNDLLVFTFLPLAVMATNSIEYSQNTLRNELVLGVSILAGFFCFFSQL